MKTLTCLRFAMVGLLAAMFLPCVSPVQAQTPGTGYIQVTSEPGVQVFLDGAFKGLTNSAQGGLILTEVSPGAHRVKLVKEGFQEQESPVQVRAGGVAEQKVQPFTPKLEIVQRGAAAQQQVVQKVGTLLIQTLPVSSQITITALGVRQVPKDQDEWEANKVPTGTYTATFTALGRTVNHTFEIKDGQRTHLFVNILENKVEDRSPVVPRPGATAAGGAGRGGTVAGGGNAMRITDLNLALAWIAPGSFNMGSASGGDDDERPVTQVTLTQGYWLGTTEVTQAQWSAIMGSNPSAFKGDTLPVEQVSWTEAMDFCRKLTERERQAGRLPSGYAYTLPTEAQWEFAARAGTTGDYAGNLDSMGWYSANSGNTTHAVGTKQANAWALYDMHGNVWEWCLDWHGNYPGGSVTDPTGAPSGTYRVLRGGGWWYDAALARSAFRNRRVPGNRSNLVGFRLALSAVR